MSGLNISKKVTVSAVAGFGLFCANIAQAQNSMTAGNLVELPTRERTAYVMGTVEGLAYARFRADTKASGSKDETGFNCIHDWLFADTMKRLDIIEATFRKYPGHRPSTLLSAMIKKDCGE
ncbi:MAG: hypothetical protein ACSHYC_05855 [Alphaproteobacteria bacterium]